SNKIIIQRLKPIVHKDLISFLLADLLTLLLSRGYPSPPFRRMENSAHFVKFCDRFVFNLTTVMYEVMI
ncbi:MAG: hypothetical protein WBM44_21655, partial [Waterburya sp.]